MPHCIARLLEPLLRFLAPGKGRHRPAGAGFDRPLPPTAPPRPYVIAVLPFAAPDSRRVRPYVLTPTERAAQRAEAQRQRARRRALWLAVHGIDVGPRLIHGVEVAA
ncbi:hypothetical protein [Streptomyces sp. WG-D5]